MKSNLTGFLCALILFCGSVCGKKHSDLTNLLNNLTSNYNKHARPTFDLNNPTVVQVSFSLTIIKEFEEKNSRLAIGGTFILVWQDFQMAWNPADYGGITTFLIPQTEVWKPELVLSNPYTTVKPLGHDRMDIRAHSYGFMLWIPYDVYEAICGADVTYYPFDTHSCGLVFQPWLYQPNQELTLTNLSSKVDLDYYVENGLWELVSAESFIVTTDLVQNFNVNITFKRRSMFAVINILVPISIMGLLDVLVFILPAESGERVGFSITVLLAMAVYLTIVSDTLPSSSQPSIPIICYILVADLLIGSCVTLCTIITLRFYHKAEDKIIPTWLLRITCSMMSRKQQRESRKVRGENNYNTDSVSSVELISKSRSGLLIYPRPAGNSSDYLQSTGRLNNMNHKVKPLQNDGYDELETSFKETKWEHVAAFFDAFFLVFFLILIISKIIATFVVFLCLQ